MRPRHYEKTRRTIEPPVLILRWRTLQGPTLVASRLTLATPPTKTQVTTTLAKVLLGCVDGLRGRRDYNTTIPRCFLLVMLLLHDISAHGRVAYHVTERMVYRHYC